MKVVLLGANGQLGSDITRELEARPDSPIQLIPITRDQLNVEQPDTIANTLAELDFNTLINCTSYHKTDEVESNAQKAVAVNAHAVRALAESCATKNARLLHISTDYVFSGLTDKPYTESDTTGPLNVYGTTKLMGEALAQSANPNTVIFRVASLFGIAGASGKGGNFVETMIKFGKEKGALKVVADQIMSPTATADVATLILNALEKNIPPGIYNAVNTGRASWFEFARQIIERANVNATVSPIPATDYPVPAKRPAFSALDNTKLTNQLGPIPHWRDALDRYLAAKGHLAPATT